MGSIIGGRNTILPNSISTLHILRGGLVMKKYIGNILSSCSLVLSIIVMILYALTISNTTSALGESWFYILISLAIVALIVSNFLNSFKSF